jgi:uncharacterized paraquat-inducible protein A
MAPQDDFDLSPAGHERVRSDGRLSQRHWGLWMRLHEPVHIPLVERFRIHLWANVRMLMDPVVLLVSSAVAVLPTLAFFLALRLLFNHLDLRRAGTMAWLLGFAGAVALWLLVQHLFFVYSMQRWYAPFVRREFGRRGMPMCERCGHRLPPQRPATCTECGAALSPPRDSAPVCG